MKPEKPYPEYPLTPHASGNWCKKIRGKIWYFGKNHVEALTRYTLERADLEAGRTPESRQKGSSGSLTLSTLVKRFLSHKQSQVDRGDLSELTMSDYEKYCGKCVAFFGKGCPVADLVASRWTDYADSLPKMAPSSKKRLVTMTRSIFSFALREQLIPDPLSFGSAFVIPKAKQHRIHRQRSVARRGKLAFDQEGVRMLLDKTSGQWRLFVLLGLNCAFGNSDIARLPWSAVDLESHMPSIEYGREKTGIERRAILWPETCYELSRLDRQGGLVFQTKFGNRYKPTSISTPFGEMLERLGMKRHGLNFYSLRRTFETVASEKGPQHVVDYVMGHLDDSMAAVYRQEITDESIRDVCYHVRGWALGE